MSLTDRARSGALWSGASALAIRVTSFASGVVVARLVAPDQVGTFVVALTVQVIVISASELGVGSAIARLTDRVEDVAPTAVTLALVSSGILAVGMALMAEPIAQWFNVPDAVLPLRIMALTIVCAGASTVSNGLLMREFAGRRRFVAEGGNTVAATAVLLILLAFGWGAMALALSRLAGQITSSTLLIALAPRRFLPGFDRHEARRLLGFGLPLIGASTLGFATVNLDNVAVGRIAGAAPLGSYSLAFNVASWPFSILTSMVYSVTLPAFAGVDDEDLHRRVHRALAATAAVAVPAGALLAALADPLVRVIYGSTWQAAIGPLAVLAAFGVIRAPLDVLGNLVVARGLTRAYLALQAATFVAAAVLLPILVMRWGALGAAWALGVITVAVVAPGVLAIVTVLVKVPLRLIAGAVVRPILLAPVVGLSAYLTAGFVADRGGLFGALVAGTLVGGGLYVVLLHRWLRAVAEMLGIGIARRRVAPAGGAM